MPARLSRAVGSLAELAGRAVRSLPGVASMGCGVTGSAILWGTGWAFLTAAGFLAVAAFEVN